jgi:anthranilate synthase/aminodeoxychorismate synthase-like glutamine amidotransferase
VKIALLDCEDSYTYNIYDYLAQLGVEIEMIHYSNIKIESLIIYLAIILPPGPKSPADLPILFDIIDMYKSRIPILAICLGHQAIGSYFGHKIVQSNYPTHGISIRIDIESSDTIFNQIDSANFMAMRYNSLTVKENNSSELDIICRDEFGDIMGFKHRAFPIYSFQFHPESIGTPQGIILFQNWLKLIKK